MKGYIGITAHAWWEYLKNKDIEKINFWCKKNVFKSLEKGEHFFFLKKRGPAENGERMIVGYAEFADFEYVDVDTAWEKYQEGNGYSTKEAFLGSMGQTLGDDNLENIGCIILKNHIAFDTPVKLSDAEIEFANSIVSGKGIDEDACQRIFRVANPDIRDLFFKYLGKADSLAGYNKSYKLIFYKMFFENNINGSMDKMRLAELFRKYYAERISQGEQADHKVVFAVEHADRATAADILPVILQNPYNVIHEKGFFDIEGENFVIKPELWQKLTDVDIQAILDLVQKKIALYYAQFGGGGEEMSIKETVEQIKQYISARGFSYDNHLIERFYLSLKSKPFVILAGTSGTGKTKLVKLFAEAINAKYKLVSVRPDWSDSSDLFGHTNLKGEFIPGAITEYVRDAIKDPDYPYFLCLDEMNLARVEYYLSDFLSVVETRKHDGGRIVTESLELPESALPKFGKLYLPDNLYIVGTVNMDETTYPFSKKVLDRANTIEFSYVDLDLNFEDAEAKVYPVPQNNTFLKTNYITLKTDIKSEQRNLAIKVSQELADINIILQTANLHVGYRVRDEIVFFMLNNDEAELLSYNEAMDHEIMQKILPRLQGSSSSLKDLLCQFFKKFAGDYEAFSKSYIWEQMEAKAKEKDCKYKNSVNKLCYMMRRFEEDGFTSYWG